MSTRKNLKDSKMEVDQKLPKDEDEVVAEMDCYHLPLNRQHFSAATLQFQTEKASKMQDCVARMKPIVKHLEIDFQHNSDRDDGVKGNHGPATFSAKATSESEVLNHALGFVNDGKMYFVELDDNYKMRRMADKPSEELVEEGSVKRNLSPVRVKFARAETDAQRKRREQSSFFKTQQAAQEAWKAVPIIHEEPNFALKVLDRQVEEEIIPRNGTRVKDELVEE